MNADSKINLSIDALTERINNLYILLGEKQLQINIRFDSLDQKVQAALSSSEKAITKAETSTEKRFESVNEFRSALSDQQILFSRKAEVEIRIKGLEDKINLITTLIQEKLASEKGVSYTVGVVAAIGAFIISIAVGIVSILWKH